MPPLTTVAIWIAAPHILSQAPAAGCVTIVGMPAVIAILEDDPGRIAEMRFCLAEALPNVESVFFENAHDMIAWLEANLGDVILISLDHDLPLRRPDGKPIVCGDGRMVADYLASLPPTCPLIVHSSNNDRAPGMFFALKDAGWPVARVTPFDEHAWVRQVWKHQILKYLRDGWIIG